MWSVVNFFANSLGFKSNEELSDDHEKEFIEAVNRSEDTDFFKFKEVIGCVSDEKTGVITDLKGDTAVIDNEYYFRIDEQTCPLSLNDTVHFTVHFNNDHTFVRDVKKVFNSNIENDEESEETFTKSEKLSGQVINRQLRIIQVKIDDLADPIPVNLDKVKSEFIPCVGDYVELFIIPHENKMDTTRVKVLKIKPQKCALKLGVVTSLNENQGTISNFAVFSTGVCESGFQPMLSQRVFASLIRSDSKNGFKWRAIHIIPRDSIISEYSSTEEKKRLENEYRNKQGISISLSPKVHLNLNSYTDLTVNVTNNGGSEKVVAIYPVSLTDQDQIFLKSPSLDKVTLEPHETVEYIFRIHGKFVGSSHAEFVWDFGDFRIRRKLSFEVICDNHPNLDNGSIKFKTSFSKHITAKWILENSKHDVMPGRRHYSKTNFIPVKIDQFLVPNPLMAAALPEKVTHFNEIRIQVENVLPILKDGLSYKNYREYMHGLLFLEEIEILKLLAKLEIEGAPFRKQLDYMILDVPEFSIYTKLFVPGDFVIASLPWNKQKKQQGIIHRVTKSELWLKFAKSFHDNYNSSATYFISFSISRTPLRRMHQAVDLAVKNLGENWLFPNCVYTMRPQVIVDEFDGNLIKISEDKQFAESDFYYKKNPFIKRKSQNNFKRGRGGMWNSSGAGYGRSHEYEYNITLKTKNIKKITWFNTFLNSKQKEAVFRILQGVARPLPYIIFGPPGTGKTLTVVETILQIHHILAESRILVATPTNAAADLIAERLLDSGNLQDGDFLRLTGINYVEQGRLPASLVPYSATPNFRDGPVNESETNVDVQSFNRYQISEHRIIVGTLGCLGVLYNMGFPKGYFTHLIIDEAGQTTEPESLIIMSFLALHSGQVILSGDPLQLGPVIRSELAVLYGLSDSLLLRLINRFPYLKDLKGFPDNSGYDPRLVTKLINNYRSLKGILDLFSSLYYGGDLVAILSDEASDEGSLFKNLKSVKFHYPVLFHGVRGSCQREEGNKSWYNLQEIFQIFVYVNKLYFAGVKPDQIGIITPYELQSRKIVKYLEEHNLESPKVGSVQEYQGQEKMIIILSLVKCSGDDDELTNVNFVADPKRTNVAISRARTLLIIIGDPELLSKSDNWLSIIKYCYSNNSYVGCELPSSIFTVK